MALKNGNDYLIVTHAKVTLHLTSVLMKETPPFQKNMMPHLAHQTARKLNQRAE